MKRWRQALVGYVETYRRTEAFEEQSQWSLFKEFRDALLVQLAMPLTLTDLANHQALFCENFAENRPKRPRQLKRMRVAFKY